MTPLARTSVSMTVGLHAGTAGEDLEAAALDEADPHALSPEELKRFITAGFLELPPSPSVPAEVHGAIAAKVLGWLGRMVGRSPCSLRIPIRTSPDRLPCLLATMDAEL